MSEHTKEPWRVRELKNSEGTSVDCFVTAAREGDMPYDPEIMADDYNGYGDFERKQADARRIVACVNACEGISNKELEAKATNGTVTRILNERDKAEQQRDELLEALKDSVNYSGEGFSMSPETVKNLIERIEAGK